MPSYVPLQAAYRCHPWRVLVTCLMLNLTGRTQVRPLLDEIFSRWPDASSMAVAGPELEELIRPCGLAEQRARRLRHMSEDFLRAEVLSPTMIQHLRACGQYASDAFRVFCQGDTGFTPVDRVLRTYVMEVRDGGQEGGRDPNSAD